MRIKTLATLVLDFRKRWRHVKAIYSLLLRGFCKCKKVSSLLTSRVMFVHSVRRRIPKSLGKCRLLSFVSYFQCCNCLLPLILFCKSLAMICKVFKSSILLALYSRLETLRASYLRQKSGRSCHQMEQYNFFDKAFQLFLFHSILHL